jgi:aspartate aminotransferase
MEQTQNSHYTATSVPRASEDPLYSLKRAFHEDCHDRNIDLGIGAYRDEEGKPWVLPVVKKVVPFLCTKTPGKPFH